MNKIYRKSSLEKISSPEQLDQMLILTSPGVWLAILGGILCVAAVLVWAFTYWINTTETVSGIYIQDTDMQGELGLDNANTVRCFVPFEKSGEIKVGMDAYVYLPDSELEDYGYINGTVVKVDEEIADQDTLNNLIGEDTIISYLTNDKPVVCVYISLESDPNSENGYSWSKAAGDGFTLKDTNLVNVDVEISSKHPIAMMIPGIQPLVDQIEGE